MLDKVIESLAQKIASKYKPIVIVILGSVGKTSAQEAIFEILSHKYRVYKNRAEQTSGQQLFSSFLHPSLVPCSQSERFAAVFQAEKLLFFTDTTYPEVILLEVNPQRPGEMEYLLKRFPVKMLIVTSLPEREGMYKGNLEGLLNEYLLGAKYLPEDGHLILNGDERHVVKLKHATSANVILYGFDDGAQVQAEDFVSAPPFDNNTDVHALRGAAFKLVSEGSKIPILLSRAIGSQHSMAALAAIAVGKLMDMNLIEIAEHLKNYTPLNGRMKLIPGIKGTFIIDDSYNACPLAMQRALQAVHEIELQTGGQRFAVLGDMEGLGAQSLALHEEVGKYVGKLQFDYLYTVGERAFDIAKTARASGMPEERVYSFSHTEEAGRFLQERLEKGDLVLVSGGKGVPLEQIVKEIMAEPLRARELLVRQEEEP